MKKVYQILRNKHEHLKYVFETQQEAKKCIKLLESSDPFNIYTCKELELYSNLNAFFEKNPEEYEAILNDSILSINYKLYPIWLKNKATSKVEETKIKLEDSLRIIDEIKAKSFKKNYIHKQGNNEYVITKHDYPKLLEIYIKSLEEISFYNESLKELKKKALYSIINYKSEKENEK